MPICRNITLEMGDSTMDVITFGNGKKNLIMIPGLGDGLKTVKGMAFPFLLMYRMYVKKYRVYVFSRKKHLRQRTSTKDMADDLVRAMDLLNIDFADVIGISQGGMIAQHMAAQYPERVSRLVLAVTCSRPNLLLTERVTEWIEMAMKDDFTALMKDNVIKMYSEEYVRKYLWLTHITGLFKPKSYDRFMVMANACMNHDAHDCLKMIQCPVLIIGAQNDNVVGVQASYEIKKEIPHARLHIDSTYGHAVYDEQPEFHQWILNFLGGTYE